MQNCQVGHFNLKAFYWIFLVLFFGPFELMGQTIFKLGKSSRSSFHFNYGFKLTNTRSEINQNNFNSSVIYRSSPGFNVGLGGSLGESVNYNFSLRYQNVKIDDSSTSNIYENKSISKFDYGLDLFFLHPDYGFVTILGYHKETSPYLTANGLLINLDKIENQVLKFGMGLVGKSPIAQIGGFYRRLAYLPGKKDSDTVRGGGNHFSLEVFFGDTGTVGIHADYINYRLDGEFTTLHDERVVGFVQKVSF